MGGHVDTLTLSVIRPAVIRAHEGFALNRAEREAGSAMDTQILPDHDALTNAPDYEVFGKEAGTKGLAFDHIGGAGDDVPVVDEYRVI